MSGTSGKRWPIRRSIAGGRKTLALPVLRSVRVLLLACFPDHCGSFGTDSAYLDAFQVPDIYAPVDKPAHEINDTVCAREDEPVISFDIVDCLVERRIIFRWNDLDSREFKNLGARSSRGS